MTAARLVVLAPADVPHRRDAGLPAAVEAGAAVIVREVRDNGAAALRAHAERLGDLAPGAPFLLAPDVLAAAFAALPAADQELLCRVADRIAAFAAAQRAALADLDVAVPGGRAGHRFRPVARAGCYAPGGRFPLPSSVLMTAVTARTAGVGEVWVASPRPVPVTLAAAHVAGAAGVLAVGGAQAIAALAYGAEPLPACDVIAGPGNAWVTAAKRAVYGDVGVDMLAGPSELVVVADDSAQPSVVAADLLAQAEHDPDARPILIALTPQVAEDVAAAVAEQLATLPTAATAHAALARGFATVARDRAEAARLCDRIAPEHLAVHVRGADEFAAMLTSYGALFIGSAAAEVFGDYGVGPNHVLPTGGTARYQGALSVATFLRCQTWLRMDAPIPPAVVADSAHLARLEGLEGHARAAERRT